MGFPSDRAVVQAGVSVRYVSLMALMALMAAPPAACSPHVLAHPVRMRKNVRSLHKYREDVGVWTLPSPPATGTPASARPAPPPAPHHRQPRTATLGQLEASRESEPPGKRLFDC